MYGAVFVRIDRHDEIREDGAEGRVVIAKVLCENLCTRIEIAVVMVRGWGLEKGVW